MKKFNNKTIKTIYKILKTIFSIFLIIVLFVVILQKVTKNNMSAFGIRIFSIASESMKEEYEIGDIIIVKKAEPEEINVGDNVTYLGNKGDMNKLIVTHKVMEKRKENNDYYFITKGTSNEIADPEIIYSQIYGKVIYKTFVFSFVGRLMTNLYAYYALFVTIGLIISFQIVKIIYDEKYEDDEDGEKKETKKNI